MKNLFTILLVVMAAVLVVSVFAEFSKRTDDTDMTKPGDTEQPEAEEYGFEISFAEGFFSQLQQCDLRFYVDGVELTEMPSSGIMRGVTVEFVNRNGDGVKYVVDAEYSEPFLIYVCNGAIVESVSEFSTPVLCSLRSDIHFDSVSVK